MTWFPLLCRSYRFVMMVYSSQLIIMYWSWSFHGCAWSMNLQWRRSPENVVLFALRRTSVLGVGSGYISSIVVLQQVTRAGTIRELQWLLAVIRLLICALNTLYDNADIHQFVAMIQLTAAFTAVYTATSAKRETTALYTPLTIGSRSTIDRTPIQPETNCSLR